MRGFRFRSILYSERCAHICLAPSQNSNLWRPNIHVWIHFEPSCLNLFSRYVSTVGSKRRYHSSRVRVDVAGRDSCHFVQCFYTDVAKTSISNFRRVGTAFSGELPQARTVLLFGSYSGQIFPRRNLLTCQRKQYQVYTSYRLLCVIGSEMNYPPSLKLHDATLTDQ